MARARNIKPGFFINEDLVELPFSTRLLFIGLWTIADREGRLDDRPRKIKMAVFPADDVDVDAGLNELASQRLISRYQVEHKPFIQITNFSKHQNPHKDEKKSTIPAPCEPGISTVQNVPLTDSLLLKPETLKRAETAVEDPVEKRIWKDGKDLLVKEGMSRDNAGSLLGRLASQYGRPLLAEAIAVTQAENSANPKTFLMGVLKQRTKNKVAMAVGANDYQPETYTCKACFDTGYITHFPDNEPPFRTDCDCGAKREAA
jgi:hypothetical protein